METLVQLLGTLPLPLQLVIGVITAAVVFVGSLYVYANYMQPKSPPVVVGIPFIGGLLKFLKGPMAVLEEGYGKLGHEVFTVPVLLRRVTFLVGPDVSPHFFKGTDDEMSQSEVYDFNVPTFGKGVVFDVEQKIRIEQFRWFTEALKKERLKKYVPQFVAEAEQYFSKWGNEGVIDFKDEFCKLVTLTAARTLLGREVREQLFDQVAELLHHLDEGMLPISVFWPYAPIPAHFKRDRARKALSEIFGKIIDNRRKSGTREEDVLQQFIDAKYQNVYDGRAATNEEITGLLIAVLFAGQHTSSITTSWTGLRMAANKERTMAPAVEEQKRMIAKYGTELSFDILSEMDVLHRNITEALRMHPPLVMLMRYAKTPFSVTDSKGRTYVVPKGDTVAISPNYSHMLPHVFPEPTKYDPDRFAPPREEDKHIPFGYLGFGHGRHACIGSNFAYLQIKTIWSVLLRNFDFELIDPMPEPDYDSMVIGPKPCRVRYTRRKI